MSEIIKTTNLTKRFHLVCAVNNVNLTINQGDIVGLVGKNGSGKTTLIKLLSNVAIPSGGKVERFGLHNPCDLSAIIERPALYEKLTAYQNVQARCKLLNIPFDKEYADKTLNLLGIDPENKTKVGNFSLGMRQRTAIALALLGKPKMLLLDEPINGLDPEGIKEVRDILKNLSLNGVTILISSHILSELAKIATRYVFMDKGRIVAQMTEEEVEAINCARLRLTTKQADKAFSVFKEMGVDARIVSENVLELYTDMSLTAIIKLMMEHEVDVKTVARANGTLEDFYLRLVKKGGGDNV